MSLEPRSIPDKSQEILLLSRREMDRITSHLSASEAQRKAAEEMSNERKALKDASKKMTDTWTNTIAGYTKQRLKHAQKKAEGIEAERKRIDDLEEDYQDLRRRYVLDIAFKRLYQQTDRVKRLHAAKNFAEVLKEREDQHAIQQKAKHVFDDFDKEYMRSLIADVEKHEEERLAKAKNDRLVNKQFADRLLKQHNVTRKEKEKEREESLQTTRMLQEQADAYREENLKMFLEGKQKRQSYGHLLDDAISKKKHLESILRKMNETEDERAELFNDAKRRMKTMFIEKQKEMKRLKEERKSEIAGKLKDVASQIRKKEERILKRAIKEKEAKEEEKEKLKEEEKAKALEEIDAFTKQSIEEKNQAKLDEKTMKLHEGIYLKDLYDWLTAKEEKKEAQRKKDAQQNEHTILHQMAKKKDKEASEVKEELEDYARHMRGLFEEEETFQQYAKELIEECEARGLPIYPLKKAAMPGIECGKGPLRADRGNIRPKYYAAITDPDELHYVMPKPKATSSRTKARLGFCD